MGKPVCPKCGNFSLSYEPATLEHDERYVCPVCGAIVPANEVKLHIDEKKMQRFPGPKDLNVGSPAEEFLRRKK